MKAYLLQFVFFLVVGCNLALAASGEEIFKAKCALCHTYGEGNKIGPDLKGVTKKRKPDWLKNMIKDPQGWVAKDAEAKKLFEEFKKIPMVVVPALKDDEIKAVIDFLKKKDSV